MTSHPESTPDGAANRGIRRGSTKTLESVPRAALTRQEAADSLGISLDAFERHVQPELAIVRVGRLRLVPPRELVRWVDAHAERP